MKIRETPGRIVFKIINGMVLILLALLCVVPFVNVIAMSLSDRISVSSGIVTFWPVNFTFGSYHYLIRRAAFWQAFGIAVLRTALGTAVNLTLIIMTAYPLSKPSEKLKFRTAYAWYFFITMLISGGLIPSYILISNLGLKNTIWALIWPVSLPVFYLVLMLNFFRQVPSEIEDAALIDGAGHVRILTQIFVPISMPSIATIALFCMVMHWNSWFDGLLYIDSPSLVPLQTYLRNAILNMNTSDMAMMDPELLKQTSDRSLKCAQVIITCIPILCAYPFLQRYFVTGIVLGSVKG